MGKLSTVNLFALTILDELLFILKILITSYLKEEVNCTVPFPLEGLSC
jgi:hypothetical protein